MNPPITTHAQAVAALVRLVGLDEALHDADTIFCRTADGDDLTAGDIVDCLRPDLRQPVEYRTETKPAAKRGGKAAAK